MKDRAEQFCRDMYGLKDPEAAIVMLAQLWAEISEWLQKYPAHMVAEAFIGAVGASADTMAAIDKHLAQTTDPAEKLRHNAKVMKEAMALASSVMAPGTEVRRVIQ